MSNSELIKLEKKVFIFDTSEGDKRFFKNEILRYVNGEGNGKSFSQFMWHAIWVRNEKGKTCKYLDFNERTQKLYLDKYFYEWMTTMIKLIEHTNNLIQNEQ